MTTVVHVVAGVARAARARPGAAEGTLVVGSEVFAVQCVVEYAAERTAVALLERLSAREAREPPMARPLPPPLDEALLAGDEFVMAKSVEGGRRASASRRARSIRFGDLRLADAQRLWRAGDSNRAPKAENEADANPSGSEEEEEGEGDDEDEEEEVSSDEAELDPEEEDDDEGRGARAASSEDERLSSEDESSVGEDGGEDGDDFDMNDPDGDAEGAVGEEEE